MMVMVAEFPRGKKEHHLPLSCHSVIKLGHVRHDRVADSPVSAKAGIELGENGSIFPRGSVVGCLVVGQQIIVPKNLEQRPSKLSLIVVTDLVVPHWLSSPIRS